MNDPVGDAARKPTLDDPARLSALQRSELLDTPVEERFDRITRLAAAALGVPVALVSLADDHRQFFKSQHGLPEPWASLRETPLSHSFCQHGVSQAAPLIASSTDGIYTVDTDGVCTLVNRAASDILGFAPGEVLGRNMHDLVHHHHADGTPFPEANCPLFHAFRDGRSARVHDTVR